MGAVAVTTLIAALFYKQLIHLLIAPLPGCQSPDPKAVGHGCAIVALSGLLSPFTLALKVSLTAGVLGASPVWLYQLWAFVAPGLREDEKKYTRAFLGAGIPLFVGGAALAYVALPASARILLSFTPDGATNILPVDDYLNLATRMVLVFGASFELPLLLVMLNVAGVLSAGRMAGCWRPMVLGITTFSALATPSTDPLSMLLLAGPIVLLYLMACAVARNVDRRRGKQTHQASDDARIVAEALDAAPAGTSPPVRL